MASVHQEISKKVNEKVSAIEMYKKMDQKREDIISELVESYREGSNVDLTILNNWTEEMNQFAVKNQLPARKLVTSEMFVNFARSIKS